MNVGRQIHCPPVLRYPFNRRLVVFQSRSGRFGEGQNCLPLTGFEPQIVPYPNHYSCILQSVLQQVHSLFQGKFTTECNIVLPSSVSSTIPFPQGHPVVAYFFSLVFALLLFFPLPFLQQRVLESLVSITETNTFY